MNTNKGEIYGIIKSKLIGVDTHQIISHQIHSPKSTDLGIVASEIGVVVVAAVEEGVSLALAVILLPVGAG